MTLTLSDLTEWRRAELENPGMQQPPANFMQELKPYLQKCMQEAGPDPALWTEDCEPFTARQALEDIFRLRRAKLARAAELNPDDATLPPHRNLLEFESCCWFGLTEKYRLLDKVYKDVCSKGDWSGKWGRP